MNFPGVLLGLAVAVGAGFALRVLDESRRPEALAFQAMIQAPPDVERVLMLSNEAVQRDSANPYRWSDLGAAFVNVNDLAHAHYCYRRALELSRDVPIIWLRDANFHFQVDEPEEALASAARVLRSVPDYDSTLFSYLDQVIPAPAKVLAKIEDARRATLAYTEHLLQVGNLDGAMEAWHWGIDRKFNDLRPTVNYIDALLKAHRYEQAQRDWASSWGSDRGEYPDRNLLFNGDFEREPTGCDLDWRVTPSTEFETIRDKSSAKQGQWSLLIRFRGTGNVAYENVEQLVRVTPGPHTLRAWIRTDAISTREGVRFRIIDAEAEGRLDVRTEAWTGTHDWTPVNQSFTVPPGTNLVAVRLVRRVSEEFDNRIKGSLWVDDIRLTRNPSAEH